MAPTLRVFLALNLPPHERRAIREATASMRAAAPGLAWVIEDNLHLTLKFLGPQEQAAIDTLRDNLAPVIARVAPMALDLGGLGAFPNRRTPRVIWLGVAAEARLELLHHDIETTCGDLGYEMEGRTFRPHITLGRARAALAAPAANALSAAARDVRFTSRVPVASLEIMASEIATLGSIYRQLASLPLEGRS
jgi:RNA 2',3'-cyclic 3'-phosphodiesterase